MPLLASTIEHASQCCGSLNGPSSPEGLLACDYNLDWVFPLHELRPACRYPKH